MKGLRHQLESRRASASRVYLADEIIGKHYSRFFLATTPPGATPVQLQFATIQGRYGERGLRCVPPRTLVAVLPTLS